MFETSDANYMREENVIIWSDRKHYLWFPFSFTKYKVSNGRIYIRKGFFNSREDECLLYRILDISMVQSFGQKIFGTGTIELNTKDRSTPVILLESIGRPDEVKRLLSDLIEAEREEKKIVGKDMYGSSVHFDPVEVDGGPGDHFVHE